MTRTLARTCEIANRRALTAVTLLLVPSIALAHPEHGEGFLPGLLHPFHGLDHLLAAIAVGLWGARIGGRALWAFPLAFVVAMIAGAMLGSSGIALSAAEWVIALSVLALGAAVTFDARLSVPAGAAIVAGFALFHGGAHGAEAPIQQGFVTYALGLVLATAGLHGSGIAICVWLKSRPWMLRIVAAPIALAGATMLFMRLA